MKFEFAIKSTKTHLKKLYLHAVVSIPFLFRFSLYILGLYKFSLRIRVFIFGVEISWGWN
jgi:hypothetical protein